MVETQVADTVAVRDTLSAVALRATRGRMSVLHVLAEHPHSDAEQVHALVRRDLPGISVQSVHNALNDLTRVELVRRIEPSGSTALYECRTRDNHHHAICLGCGAVSDVECVSGVAPCLDADLPSGFHATEAEIVFWGMCAPCSAWLPVTHQSPRRPPPHD